MSGDFMFGGQDAGFAGDGIATKIEPKVLSKDPLLSAIIIAWRVDVNTNDFDDNCGDDLIGIARGLRIPYLEGKPGATES
jgi:hypothetical protein